MIGLATGMTGPPTGVNGLLSVVGALGGEMANLFADEAFSKLVLFDLFGLLGAISRGMAGFPTGVAADISQIDVVRAVLEGMALLATVQTFLVLELSIWVGAFGSDMAILLAVVAAGWAGGGARFAEFTVTRHAGA